ncbi:MAG: lysoplasmalogenase [Cyclobacteriaceae bacterium]|jgi:uncharacterized membrane protein YhhN
MKKFYLAAFVLASFVHVAGHVVAWPELAVYTKPLLMPLLLAYYATSGTHWSRWVIGGLVLGWVGDVALMFSGEFYFMAGLGSFLLGHLAYMFAYREHRVSGAGEPFSKPAQVRIALPILLLASLLVTVLRPELGGLLIPVMAYAFVIALMVIQALYRKGFTSQDSFFYVAAGAFLFMISDSLLAINKFLHALPLSGLWIMTTYLGAQFLIVAGLRKHPGQNS